VILCDVNVLLGAMVDNPRVFQPTLTPDEVFLYVEVLTSQARCDVSNPAHATG